VIKVVKDKAQTPKVWVFVADSRNNNDLSDLDHLDEILWGSNPNTRKGDIVLMYRTAPYSDIAYVFSATSDPRPTRPADRADMKYVIELGEKIRLSNPVTLKELRKDSRLSHWSFARHQQGVMQRTKDIKQEGFWKNLRAMIVKRNSMLSEVLAELEGSQKSSRGMKSTLLGRGRPAKKAAQRQLRVFISYASPDVEKVRRLYRKLRREGGLDLWFDRESLIPADNWQDEITRAIRSSDIIVICLSARSVLRPGFAQREIRWALEIADEQPEGTTSILPVKLEPCKVPDRLARAQYAELFSKGGYERLVAGLRKRSAFLEETGTK
jgi:hypothetical protein